MGFNVSPSTVLLFIDSMCTCKSVSVFGLVPNRLMGPVSPVGIYKSLITSLKVADFVLKALPSLRTSLPVCVDLYNNNFRWLSSSVSAHRSFPCILRVDSACLALATLTLTSFPKHV